MKEYILSREIIYELMKKKNIKSQTELAQLMGITKHHLSTLLSPKFNPIKNTVENLCNVLEVDLLSILEEKSQHNLQEVHQLSISDFEINKKETILSNINSNEYIDTSKISATKNYTVLELFAGAGGLALGLEKSGFKSLGLVELDRYAAKTLELNRPNWNVINKDIIEVAKEGIFNYIPKNEELDLLSGGYPCQSFSYAGKKLGLEDIRGTMFYYFSKILEQTKPKMFLAENVRGLISHDKGRTLQTMIDVFSSIGYKVTYKILKALHYGVAQKRERIVIIGIRNDLNLDYQYPQPYDYQLTLKDALENVPNSVGAKYPDSKKRVLDLVPPGGYWRDLPEEIAKEYMGASYYSGGGRTGMARRIGWHEPSLTLTCSPAQKQTERCHPEETRPFTTREYARIQSFPDDWKFYGSMNQVYKQIGNAVPVEFAKAIGLSIVNTLNKISH